MRVQQAALHQTMEGGRCRVASEARSNAWACTSGRLLRPVRAESVYQAYIVAGSARCRKYYCRCRACMGNISKGILRSGRSPETGERLGHTICLQQTPCAFQVTTDDDSSRTGYASDCGWARKLVGRKSNVPRRQMGRYDNNECPIKLKSEGPSSRTTPSKTAGLKKSQA